MGGSGTALNALSAGGRSSAGPLTATEVWSGPGSPTTKTITTS